MVQLRNIVKGFEVFRESFSISQKDYYEMLRCVVEFTNNPPSSLLAQRNATRSRTKLLRKLRKSLLDVEGDTAYLSKTDKRQHLGLHNIDVFSLLKGVFDSLVFIQIQATSATRCP